ncbi:MAG: hypothetical protein JXA13_08860 [Anaerolineales bacterium]|nr:hypothetical protein [Anaerolineales bacterium]
MRLADQDETMDDGLQMYSRMKGWRLFFIFVFIMGFITFLGLILIPSDPKNNFLLGYSLSRSILLLGMLVVLVSILLIAYGFRRGREGIIYWLNPSLHLLVYERLIWVVGIATLLTAVGMFIFRYYDPDRFLPFYIRVEPVLVFVLLTGFTLTLFLLWLLRGLTFTHAVSRKPVYLYSGIILLVLLVVWIFVAITGLGITPDSAYWGEPGVPIHGWMMGLAVLSGLFAMLAWIHLKGKTLSWLGMMLPLAIWGITVLIWQSVPITILKNSFYAPITLPDNRPYPLSDAAYYDYNVQNVLLGNGYTSVIPPRPLYIAFLTGLHALFGERYDLIIFGQACLLALFPVVLYYLGKMLHSRYAGVLVASLAIFRELSALLVSSQTRVSNSKMFLTDIPTALAVTAACLFVMRWLRDKDCRKSAALVAGGMFGLLLLLRTQSMLLLPIVILTAWLAYWPKWKDWSIAIVIFSLGVIVTVTPWLTHNRMVSGSFTLDSPNQMGILSSQYSLSDNLSSQALDPSESVVDNVIQFTIEHPAFVAGFITNHFLAVEIDGLLALPLIETYNGLRAPVNLYWMEWDGTLAWYNILVVLFYLALISIGIGTAWQRLRWIGLTPMFFSLGYALTLGVARFSGWRYNLPADWGPYMYFGLGVAELLSGAALVFGVSKEKVYHDDLPKHSPIVKSRYALRWSWIGIIAGFFLVGAVPWILEKAIPAHFEDLDRTAVIGKLIETPAFETANLDPVQLRDISEQPETVIFMGRLLYPRFYRSNSGMSATKPWPAYARRDFPRVGFLVVNKSILQGVLPLKEVPKNFSHGSDVILIGCPRGEGRTAYIDVISIAFLDEGLIYTYSPLPDNCQE